MFQNNLNWLGNRIKEAKNFENKQGYVTKEREVLKWAKTRKKHNIRRDDLIANVTGTTVQRPSSYYNESRGTIYNI